MQDDRDRYMAEIIEQADGRAGYITAFIDTSESRRPWTMELINCGYAIGNVAYFYYKQQFRRVRPSTLCPGLAPPFGPPAHPSFTSGHSFIGHFIALLLLEIPALRQRYGMFATPYDGSRARQSTPPAVTISQANPAVVTLSALIARAERRRSGEFPFPGALPRADRRRNNLLRTGRRPDCQQLTATLQISADPSNGARSDRPRVGARRPADFCKPLWGAASSRRRCFGLPSVSPRTANVWASTILQTRLEVATLQPVFGERCCTTAREPHHCPTLRSVLAHATAEWPTKWP